MTNCQQYLALGWATLILPCNNKDFIEHLLEVLSL